MAVGAALALRDSGRLPVAVLGDGDFLMGATALWTAVHYRIPLLVVVSNNNSFFNDELHQDRMARQRGRPVANRWIGQRIADPEPDLGMLARAQGGEGFGPIRRPDELPRALTAQSTDWERPRSTYNRTLFLYPSGGVHAHNGHRSGCGMRSDGAPRVGAGSAGCAA